MGNPFSGLDADRWYLLWIAASLLGLLGAMAAKEPRYVGVAFGCVLFGFGELINHPKRMRIGHDGYQVRFEITDRTRKNSVLGVGMILLGLLFAGYNIVRLAFLP